LIILHQPPGDINNGPFGQDGEEFKEDSLGIKGDEVENFQNLSFGLLVFVNEIWVSCTSGSRELLCK